ncbi:MAG TPA: 3-oxoacyl-ACP synthase III family protein [Pyrinomonadaceae bacterium]|jgi:3-oxoacyl-[acyl-carrier-protein] synthase-3
MKSIITGTGSVLPALIVPNSHFETSEFYDKNGNKNDRSSGEIVAKLEAITGIRERRYVPFDEDSIPLMTRAAQNAIDDASIDVNRLSGIIVAHNAGNMVIGERDFHPIPNLAACLKNALQCTNHECFAYDILFGCPGWLQALIQAHQAILCGDAESVLVVGLEVASRLLDPHDVDSMILADGCGACVLSKSEAANGILAYATYSHAQEDLGSIYLGKSCNKDLAGSCYFHMNGREVYKYATAWVPKIIKKTLDKAGLNIQAVDLFLFHQANAKMLEAIAKNLGEIYEVSAGFFAGKIPTTIEFLGNTSVATIPTMLDLVRKNRLDGFEIKKGQIAVMASVGAGMHCNSLIYQF